MRHNLLSRSSALNPSVRTAGRLFAAVVILAASAACSDDRPTAAVQHEALGARATIQNAAELRGMLDDLEQRVLPALPQGTARTELLVTIDRLDAAIAAAAADGRHLQQAELAVSQVRDVLQQVRGTVAQSGHTSELDAIGLGLDVVASSIPK
jgi:hypothetical protein